jgi:oligosaccharide reducing-end xylanase
MVMALYFASGRWGDGEGIYNYRTWADKILTAIRHHPLKRGMTKFGPRTVHNMVSEEHFMIRFVPDSGSWGFTDPSYHLPAFYQLWSKWGPEADRAFWAAAADTSRAFFRKATNLRTGLAPDYANFDGTPHTTRFNQRSGNFSFDARRTQMNWSVDWSWWRKDPAEVGLSNRLQSFFASQGIDTYGTEYSLDGQMLNKGHAKGLVATNAVMSLAADHPLARDFTEALWKTPVPSGFNERYYDGLLYMMAILHCSGEFRIWTPKPPQHGTHHLQ